MGKTRRSTSKRAATMVRKTATEKAPADVTRQYARILGEHGAIDRRLSDVIRVCLRAIAQRLPLGSRIHREAEALLERVIRLGELGALDLIGTAPAIAAHIAATLHEAPLDPRSVYRVLKALYKQTSLVDHPSRMVWTLRLSGLCDPSSPLHQALLAETPSPYHLSEQSREADAPPREPLRQDPLVALRAELVELRRVQAEDRRRLARVEAELAALREQLAQDGAALAGSPEPSSQPVEEVDAAPELDAPSSTREDPPAADVLPLTQVDPSSQDAQVSPVEDETDRLGPTLLAEVPASEDSSEAPDDVDEDDEESRRGVEVAVNAGPSKDSPIHATVTPQPAGMPRRRKRKRRRRGGPEAAR